MEKFALLNLLKALDGLKNLPEGDAAGKQTTAPPTRNDKTAEKNTPNIMFETLMRHEQVSNRLKNKRNA